MDSSDREDVVESLRREGLKYRPASIASRQALLKGRRALGLSRPGRWATRTAVRLVSTTPTSSVDEVTLDFDP
jgi:hypothetical protein